MTALLWKYFLEDDLDRFRLLLEETGPPGRTFAQKSTAGGQDIGYGSLGSSRGLATSPNTTPHMGYGFDAASPPTDNFLSATQDVKLSKADINRTDGKGMTILHYAASSVAMNAKQYALALVAHPLIDLYIQDRENGWTALHRAFYFGNITVARAIVHREAELLFGLGGPSFNANGPRLIKVKDNEGNGPFDLIAATVKDRLLHKREAILPSIVSRTAHDDDDGFEDSEFKDPDDIAADLIYQLNGDELYTFGSNKNLTLGFGDQDDRQYPERPVIRRPDHLYQRIYREELGRRAAWAALRNQKLSEKIAQTVIPADATQLPAVIRATPVKILDVQMSKFHTAVLTDDPVSNLHVCGHGPGGRLGTGSEQTQFNFVCIDEFGGAGRRRVTAVALGQDHTLAVTDQGEIFTWGSNVYGQLGCGMPKTTLKPEDAVQSMPKQLFGVLKRELVVGVAAARFHSVAHTASEIFTWGKNDGQLGLTDAGARSLDVQSTPRNVTPSRFSKAILSVAATEKATVCMLKSREVYVFANFGLVKLDFPLDSFNSAFLGGSFLATKYDRDVREICKITCGGDTICALSTAGEVFAVTVRQLQNGSAAGTSSTTNPNKIRAGLSRPECVWSLRKDTMAARDVGVDQDGSIILTTEAGGVWRRMHRTKSTQPSPHVPRKAKDFKFARVPNLTRVVAIRASSSGAYCAIRHDCAVTKTQIGMGPTYLWDDFFKLFPFKKLAKMPGFDASHLPISTTGRMLLHVEWVIRRLAQTQDLEKDINDSIAALSSTENASYDVVLAVAHSNMRIPAHHFLLAARSPVLRSAFSHARSGRVVENDCFTVKLQNSGTFSIVFNDIDIMALIEFVVYIYTDHIVAEWGHDAVRRHNRFRDVRAGLTPLAMQLEMPSMEKTARRFVRGPPPCLSSDFEVALLDRTFFEGGDVILKLKDEDEITAHSTMLAKRCPYFKALFEGAADGQWLQSRWSANGKSKVIDITLDDIPLQIAKMVLRHIYTDATVQLFDDITATDMDDFLDLVLEVQDAANFLMLDRLSEGCQVVLGKYVTTRNAGFLLNEVAACSVPNFKHAILEYFCLNMEAMIANQLLDDLDDDLMDALDEAFRANQLDCLPFAKSGRADEMLFERYPELPELIERSRRAKLDSIALQSKLSDPSLMFGKSYDPNDDDLMSSSAPSKTRRRHRPSTGSSPSSTPALRPQPSIAETMAEHEFALPSALDGSPLLTPHGAFGSMTPTGLSIPAAMGSTPIPMSRAQANRQVSGSSMASPNSYVGRMESPRSPTVAPLDRSPSQPWGFKTADAPKLGMKEIMEQTSSPRPSGIALGLLSQNKSEDKSSSTFNSTRMSQKDRKKIQQQQNQQAQQAMQEVQRVGSVSSTPQSPWQAVSNAKSKAPVIGSPQGPKSETKPQPTRAATTTQLTMRQTVANTPSSKQRKQPAADQSSSPLPSTPQRSVSSPQVSPQIAQGQSGSSSTPSKAAQIQSIRHTPSRVQSQTSSASYMHQSLADIISHEEAEKMSIKEAAKSRSLLEIQQEQAFEEWWQAESRAVQEEEAARAARSQGGKSRGGSSSSRGNRNRKRPAKSSKESAGKDQAQSTTPQGVGSK